MPINDDEIEKMFSYQAPTSKAVVRHKSIDQAAKDMARAILNNTPETAEQTLAIRALQQARHWANTAIALNHDKL